MSALRTLAASELNTVSSTSADSDSRPRSPEEPLAGPFTKVAQAIRDSITLPDGRQAFHLIDESAHSSRFTMAGVPFAQGAFSQVYRATLQGKPYVVKTFHCFTPSSFFKEFEVTQSASAGLPVLHCQLALKGRFYLAILMPNHGISFGQVLNSIAFRSARPELQDHIQWFLMRQAFKRLEEQHYNELTVHRDCHFGNLLIRPETGETAVSDFGYSRRVQDFSSVEALKKGLQHDLLLNGFCQFSHGRFRAVFSERLDERHKAGLLTEEQARAWKAVNLAALGLSQRLSEKSARIIESIKEAMLETINIIAGPESADKPSSALDWLALTLRYLLSASTTHDLNCQKLFTFLLHTDPMPFSRDFSIRTKSAEKLEADILEVTETLEACQENLEAAIKAPDAELPTSTTGLGTAVDKKRETWIKREPAFSAEAIKPYLSAEKMHNEAAIAEFIARLELTLIEVTPPEVASKAPAGAGAGAAPSLAFSPALTERPSTGPITATTSAEEKGSDDAAKSSP